ncbi:uncharacterized protein LOC143907738 isoform X2 [Temnothorax americanus]|uniref:uncharacterized protein LOC143907738 isoform X2 n=1 Tax=Temnothorax americanus TaxID=1964332 RepID=UPI0040682921
MYINLHKEMICIESLHISLNRFLLLVVGLWPYQQSKLVQIQLILFIGILASFILFQFAVFLTLKCTSDLFINVFSSALFCTMIMIKYILFSVNTNNVKYLLEQLQHIYNELTDENEISIIEKYNSYAKRYTITLSLIATFAASALILYILWPHISNILFFTNGTQSLHSLPFMTEYFIDKEKYFYLILLHANAALMIGCTALIATGSILIVYQKHTCGMFRITCYRIERAMAFETLPKNNWKSENLIYKGLICAVDMHRKAMKLAHSIVSRFKVMISLLIIVGVIGASLNFFRIISFGFDTVELSLHVMFSIIYFIYAFVGNYLAQEIMDHNNNVFVTIYNAQWYVGPLQIQKMILFLLQRGTKAFTMNIAGLYVGSLEGAATLLSTAVSYFTVLYSIQN